MSIEFDLHNITFNEFKKKYGYKYINIWVAEKEIDVLDFIPLEDDVKYEIK